MASPPPPPPQQQQHPNPPCPNSQNSRGWRHIILNFTPSWFAITMGTGITSILLHNLPYNAPWLHYLSIAIFCLNVVLFLTFLTISVLRYVMFPGLFAAMLRHPVQSLFLGMFPMGLATIVNMLVFVCVPFFGGRVVMFVWGLWWVDVVLALGTALVLPFMVMGVHRGNELANMTAVWLLPVVAPIVAAASGGVVADVLPDPRYAVWTVITSYILFGMGFPLAMMVLTMYFQRLTMHHLPKKEVIVSVFLPLGPLGQGSFVLMQLGKVARKVFPLTHAFASLSGQSGVDVGGIFCVVGHLAGLIIWGFGLVWLFFALASISRSRFPFNMGWWGFTFPLGVFAVSTCTIAQDLPSEFLKVVGTGLSVAVVMLWLGIGVEMARRVVGGEIFFAPCVQGWEIQRKVKQAEEERKQSGGERGLVE